MQRTALHGGLAQAQGLEQRLGARAGAEDDALGTNFTVIDTQADELVAFFQGFDALAGQ